MTPIIRVTSLNRHIQGFESVSKPCAQFAELCQHNTNLDAELSNILDIIVSGSDSRILERILCDLMLSGGLRVSEVLDLADLKVNVLGQVFIFGRKGSDSKLVTPIYFKNYWLKKIPVCSNPFKHISRFSFYKWLKSQGVGIHHGNKINNSVTHAMRHLHVYLMELMELEPKQMSEIIGHKSNRSLKYYLHGQN